MANKTYADMAGQGTQDILGILSQLVQKSGLLNPVNAGISAGQALGNTEAGTNPLPAMGKAMLSPYQEGVKTALKDSGKAHATEALSMGVAPEHIEQQSGISPQQMNPGQLQNSPYQQGQPGFGNPQPGLNQTVLASLPGQQTNMQSQPQMQNILQSLGQILQSGLKGAGQGMIGPEMTNATTARMLAEQKMAGNEPLQKGEREKIGLETQKALLVEAQKLQKEGLLKPQDLLTKFEQASQPWYTQRDAFSRINTSAKDPSPAGDLSVLYGYMKMLDPGSTVREGELATAKDVGSVPSRVWQAYNSVLNGKKLHPDIRKDYVDRATRLFKSAEAQQKSSVEGFANLGRANGIEPKLFMRNTALSNTNSKYVKTGMHGNQRVGMKADGTVEVIND